MRKIDYILIDSDYESRNGESGHRHVSNSRYHFVVNSEGLVIDTVDIHKSVPIVEGPIYDPDKYNRCTIAILYCGSLRPELLEQREQSPCSHELCRVATKVDDSQSWLMDHDTTCKAAQRQRKALLNLLVKLRKHFPDAKILGTRELDGKGYYHKNIIVSDAMNVLRGELSDLP